MASESSSQAGSCRRAPSGAPPAAEDAHLSPQPSSLNPEFVAMPATELVAHLKRHRRSSDFADAALVFAERERRLAEAEVLVRVGDKRVDRLQEGIRARDAQIHQAAKTEQRLRAEIRALQQPRAADAKASAGHGSGSSGRGLTQQVGVVPRKRPYRALRMNASSGFPISGDESVGFDTSVDTVSNEGEVGDDVPRHESLRMNASPRFGGRSALQAKQPRRRS